MFPDKRTTFSFKSDLKKFSTVLVINVVLGFMMTPVNQKKTYVSTGRMQF